MAGHSARKRSRRRASYRQGNKRLRQATRRALAGGHSKLIRPEHWDQRPEHPLLPEDGAPPRPVKPGPRRAKKDVWCPGRPGQKRHHYLSEIRETGPLRFPFAGTFIEVGPGKEIFELCAYCGHERTRRVRD